jgi:cytochrome c peroxidase
MPQPATNAATPAKVALGRELFFDPRLSRNERVACATCHDPAHGFSNGERVATGVDGKPGTRNVPGLLNVGYHRSLFWDGRVRTLEEQALAPIQNPREMAMPLAELVTKLDGIASYRRQFEAVFGGGATSQRIAQALAAYQRSLRADNTPFDRFLGGDRPALTPAAARGMQLFYGQARCFVCHSGPHLTDDDFHNIGTADGKDPLDAGRGAVTARRADQGAFRTPGLREVGRTAPYMHNGRFATLREVVWHYNFGGVTNEANDHRDEQLRVLYLSDEQVDDLVAFLSEGLTSLPAGRRSPP